MKFFDNYFFFTIFIHYKLKLCKKISALMNKDHICQLVSKPTPRPTKLKNFSGHSSVKCSPKIRMRLIHGYSELAKFCREI